ncbi:MAG: AIM24 family protein [Acutalibacteraceae bacterium]
MNYNYSAIGTRQNIEIIDSSENPNFRVEVMQYNKLLGSQNAFTAQRLYFMEKQNIKVRQIACYLTNSSVKMEPGAMSYFQGNIEMVSGVTLGNAVGRFFTSRVTGEKMAQPEYRGTGVVVLEPSFKHFIVIEMQQGEQVIVDKGMFYAAEGTVNISSVMQQSISAALGGGEGIFQMLLTGPGIVVLESIVPMDEINIIEMDNDCVKVDGNFAVLRSANLAFTVERSAKTLVGSAVSGEGLVNVYRGTGQLWLAPTIKVYNGL